MQNLGDRIKYLRERKKLVQKELAEKAGLTIVQLSRYETNDRKPDPDTLKRLADILETSGDYLLGRTSDPSPAPKQSLDADELAEFEAFINDPENGIFFKDYLKAPAERREEMRMIFKILQEKEKNRKPGDRQGE
ncbi:helix-turn-helix domain-containing protein [Paenibacillus sp. VMFN-D1]|uniref:helix-turn-helix domain-containing protein n=1 Tax=Paenibacillus sp. VMFN-D1 TaxID=2135608 RepID=UPI000E23B979|nr:helix-turn-helix transcriptional regulator [Paenibacillus sp. VMFN-D1]RED34709.1 transcriptional regulator with XRE-family HTH domain [Paenibacillus sp. VMFN-D1]